MNDSPTGAPLTEMELDVELARIDAMSPEEVDAHLRAQGLDPKVVAAEGRASVQKALVRFWQRRYEIDIAERDATISQRDQEIERLTRERDGEREARERCSDALRQKDAAMGELFRRLHKAGVDCSDLIS